MDCPICNTVVNDIFETPFCPTCYWELAVVPAEASQDMKSYFMGRQDAFSKCYQSIQDKQAMEQELNNVSRENTALKKKRINAISKLQKKLKILERMKSVLVDLENTNNSIRSTNAEIARMRALATQSENYQSDLQALKSEYDRVCHLGCMGQVERVRTFLINKGVI